MQTLHEGPRNLAFLLSEAPGSRSRETVIIAAGQGVLLPGTLLGQVTATKKWVASPDAEVVGQEGAETARAVLAYRVDASADAEAVTIDCDAEIKADLVIYHASVNSALKRDAKAVQLRAAGIKIR